MIRLVTFDLYHTLCHPVPSRQQRLAEVCRDLGLACRPEDFVRPDVAAEELYTVENGRWPMHRRSAEQQAAFYREMFRVLLREAGLRHDDATAEHVRAAMERRRTAEWQLFDDVLPTFVELRQRGVAIGVISNTPVDATLLCTRLGVCERVDFVVSSCLVGCEKPCREIFQAALERADVEAGAAVHVGDQPGSDALGAVGAGMHALLLDRRGLLEHAAAYERIASLAAVPAWVDARHGSPTGAALAR